jgi:WD40 repeat protein
VLLWDVATQRRLLKLDDHSGAINSVALSPDGRLLAAGGADGSIRLWDAGTGQPIDLLEGRQDQVWSVAFSPDGKWLASGGGDRKVILWDVVSRTLARTLTGHASSVNSVAFSPDGQLLASADGASTILLWDLTTLQRIGDPLIGHSSSIWSVAFSPDSRLLVSAGFDKSLVLWDVATRQQIGEPLTGYTQAITEVAFNQDGTLLASGSAGDGVTVWTIDPAAQRALACSIVNRNLSSTEWTQYMPARPYRPPCTETQPELYALGQTMARIQALQLSGDTASIETLYRRVMAWLPSADSLYLNNYVCWYGSLDGFGAIVAPACDHAVAIAPSALQPFYRDARGLARARSGDYRGAIEDFRAFVAWLPGKGLDEEKYRMSREKLIAALDAGRDPFDKDTLQKLRSE